MRFSASSARRVWEVHQHGLPHPLRSVFAVSVTLTVCSLPDLASLFHLTALMTFRDSGLQLRSPKRPMLLAIAGFPLHHSGPRRPDGKPSGFRALRPSPPRGVRAGQPRFLATTLPPKRSRSSSSSLPGRGLLRGVDAVWATSCSGRLFTWIGTEVLIIPGGILQL
jgi:hypothetical protein